LTVRVRAARAEDAAAVADIYNVGIRERMSTFETRERGPEEIADAIAAGLHPFLVAELGDRVAGFAVTSQYSERDCYAGVAECSVYVDPEARGKGVGSALIDGLAEEAARRGFHKLIGKLFDTNKPSLRLMERAGFRVVGTHHRHGRLDGEWRDVILVERSLG
jgi:L-amino acid N-acyltransferase YncA